MNIKINIIAFILLLSSPSFGQADKDIKEKDIPPAAKEYLNKNYPDAQNIKYYKELEKDSVFYEAEFKSKADKYSLLFLPDGSLFETEIEMSFEQFPALIKDKISKDLSLRYAKFKINKAEKVNPQTGLKYEISLHGKKGKHSGYFELFYDSNGNFISEEEETLKSIPSNSGF
jgi:hypothetical protein